MRPKAGAIQFRTSRKQLVEVARVVAANVAIVLVCYCFTLLASILIEVSSSFVVNALSTGNGFSMPR